MTVTTQTASVSHTGNGVTTVFSVPFKFLSDDDLQVSVLTIATGVATILSSTAYTVSGAGDENGGTVTYNPGTPVPSTQKVIIKRIMSITQDLDLEREGGFFPEAVETQLDRLAMMIQNVADDLAEATGDGLVTSITKNVAGPNSSTVDNFASFANGTGTLLKDSGKKAADFALADHTHTSEFTAKIKTANSTRTSTTTLSSDADLTFTMLANTTYSIRGRLYIESPAGAGYKMGITGPASPTNILATGQEITAAAANTVLGVSSYSQMRNNTPGLTVRLVVNFDIRIENGTNAGAFAFQFAQNASSATATTILKGSFLEYRVV